MGMHIVFVLLELQYIISIYWLVQIAPAILLIVDDCDVKFINSPAWRRVQGWSGACAASAM